MELKKLHIADGSAGAICHGDAIAGSDRWIRRIRINLTRASSGEKNCIGTNRFSCPIRREHGHCSDSVPVEAKVRREFKFGEGDLRNALRPPCTQRHKN